jgi:uncharacterized protein (DUF2062 family)
MVNPVMGLLRRGADPDKLAWSLAMGMVVGVNPLLGSTTVVALGLASLFRLNFVASQVGNHAVYPVEILMFPVFIKMGSVIFRTPKLPLAGHALWDAVKRHPWHTTQLLWTWEWHALVVWSGFAMVAAPIIAKASEPVLRKMAARVVQGKAELGASQD